MRKLLVSNLRTHAGQYTATAIAIALSTAFIITCLAISGGFSSALTTTFASTIRGADMVVAPTDGFDRNESDLDASSKQLREVQQDLNAKGFDTRLDTLSYAEVYKPGQDSVRSGGQLIAPVGKLSQFDFSSGGLPHKDNEVALPAGAAKTLEVSVGDEVMMDAMTFTDDPASQKPATMKVSGIIGSDKTVTAGALLVPQKLGEKLTKDDHASRLLVAGSGAKAAVNDAIKGHDWLTASTLDEFVSDTIRGSTGNGSILLVVSLIFPAIAALTAMIVISTTYKVLLARRERELGLLRAVGADAGQVRRLVLGETLLVGLVSAVVGVALGAVLGAGANSFAQLVPSFLDGLEVITPPMFLGTIATGVAMSMIAGFRPALRASRVKPIVALQHAATDTRSGKRRIVSTVLGVLLAVAGGAAVFVGYRETSASTHFVLMLLGSLVLFVGLLVLVAVVLPHITTALGKVLRFSVTSSIAAGNTGRNPGRTGATGTALVLGITLVTTLLVGAQSMEKTLNNAVNQARPLDVNVVAPRSLSAGELEAIGRVKGVHKMVTTASGDAQVIRISGQGTPGEDSGTPADSAGTPGGDAGTAGAEDADLFLDKVALQQDLSGIAHSKIPTLKPGEIGVPKDRWDPEEAQIDVKTSAEALTLKPVLMPLPTYTLSKADFDKLFTISTSSGSNAATPAEGQEQGKLKADGTASDNAVIYIGLDDGLSPSETTDAVSTIKKSGPDLSVGGGAPERAVYSQIINGMMLGALGMLGVSVIVALVGVANTLALSVLERKRENGLLRALGMTRRDVKRMLSVEAILISAVSVAIGIAAGIGFGWLGVLSIPMGDNTDSILSIPWHYLAITALIALLAALVASWLPGRKAAKAHPVEALAAIE
ncbi:FtsX-like permease family protein [Gleimia hominis]|uniref:FtsX-like permease family protein n=1 Tax=Gleimia hominis TaxID=595468 RepID=UPI000C7FD47D|nr:ABC transporter permease [Gleimia hominis]WIK64370.1 FtsX-like permease family protein [Gleimia hominis]